MATRWDATRRELYSRYVSLGNEVVRHFERAGLANDEANRAGRLGDGLGDEMLRRETSAIWPLSEEVRFVATAPTALAAHSMVMAIRQLRLAVQSGAGGGDPVFLDAVAAYTSARIAFMNAGRSELGLGELPNGS